MLTGFENINCSEQEKTFCKKKTPAPCYHYSACGQGEAVQKKKAASKNVGNTHCEKTHGVCYSGSAWTGTRYIEAARCTSAAFRCKNLSSSHRQIPQNTQNFAI